MGRYVFLIALSLLKFKGLTGFGWPGAGGTEYWIDPKSGVACVLTTNMLPARSPVIAEMKERLERAIYEELVL